MWTGSIPAGKLGCHFGQWGGWALFKGSGATVAVGLVDVGSVRSTCLPWDSGRESALNSRSIPQDLAPMNRSVWPDARRNLARRLYHHADSCSVLNPAARVEQTP